MIDADRLRRHVGDVSGMPGLFFEAAATERKLPGVLRRRYRVIWPKYVDDPNLAFGYNDAKVPLGAASAEEVTRYDAVLELSQVLSAEDAKLVWACAHSSVRRQRGPAWSKVARIVGTHPATVKRRFEGAMIQLWYALERAERRADAPDGLFG
ncbi:putative sigma-factor like protein [uncultured Mediterranean phage uvDeep-CGR0-AD1-C123]|nr:putative sigma-factor like protein [uncultured Mediterranean phage uvDeep-CGR0-AD1-C123]